MADSGEKITISSGLIEIEDGSYYGRKDITAVNFGKNACSLGRVGAQAFAYCTNLKSVELPDSVNWIGENAFSICESLTSITLPRGLKKLSPGILASCHALKSVKLPENLREIGDNAFIGTGLTSIEIPDSVKHIGREAFRACEQLESVNIPPGVEEIHSETFSGCHSLKNIALPEGLKIIGERAFINCHALEEIYIPGSVEYIGSEAFEYSGLKTLVIGEGVTTLPYSAFFDCHRLEKIVIPKSVENIDEYAFYNTGHFRELSVSGYRAVITSEMSFSPNTTAFIRRAKHIADHEIFSDRLVRDLRVPLFVDMYGKTHDPKLVKYLIQDGQFAVENAIESYNIAAISAFTEIKDLINKDNIDLFIKTAIKAENKEAYLILVKHKEEISGFENGYDRFKL